MTDSTDNALINALAKDARASVTDLAKTLGLARSTVQLRLDRLEADGTIAGYTVRLGEPAQNKIRATVLLQVSPRATPSLISRLKPMSEVERVHTCSGRFDLILQLSAPTPAKLDQALDRIGDFDGVVSSETLIHLSTKLDRAI